MEDEKAESCSFSSLLDDPTFTTLEDEITTKTQSEEAVYSKQDETADESSKSSSMPSEMIQRESVFRHVLRPRIKSIIVSGHLQRAEQMLRQHLDENQHSTFSASYSSAALSLFNQIIKKYARLQNKQAIPNAMRIVKLLQTKDHYPNPDLITYNSCLSCYRQDSGPVTRKHDNKNKNNNEVNSGTFVPDIITFFQKEMLDRDMVDTLSYNILIHRMCQMGRIADATEALNQMISYSASHPNVQPDLVSFSPLLQLLAQRGMALQAQVLLDHVRAFINSKSTTTTTATSSQYPITVDAVMDTMLLTAWANYRTIPNLDKTTIEKQKQKDADLATGHAVKALYEISEEGIHRDILTYNAALMVFARHGRPRLAEILLEKIKNAGQEHSKKEQHVGSRKTKKQKLESIYIPYPLQLETRTYSNVLLAWKIYCKEQEQQQTSPSMVPVERAEHLLQEMQQLYHLEPNAYWMSSHIEILSRHGMMQRAQEVFVEYLQKKRDRQMTEQEQIKTAAGAKSYRARKNNDSNPFQEQDDDDDDEGQVDVVLGTLMNGWAKSGHKDAMKYANALMHMHLNDESSSRTTGSASSSIILYSTLFKLIEKNPFVVDKGQECQTILSEMENKYKLNINIRVLNSILSACSAITNDDDDCNRSTLQFALDLFETRIVNQQQLHRPDAYTFPILFRILRNHENVSDEMTEKAFGWCARMGYLDHMVVSSYVKRKPKSFKKMLLSVAADRNITSIQEEEDFLRYLEDEDPKSLDIPIKDMPPSWSRRAFKRQSKKASNRIK